MITCKKGVPLRLIKIGHFWGLRVTVGSRRVKAIIDTACSNTVIDRSLVSKEEGLLSEEAHSHAAIAQMLLRSEATPISSPAFEGQLEPGTVGVMELRDSYSTDMLLGMDVLGAGELLIDFPGKSLEFVGPEHQPQSRVVLAAPLWPDLTIPVAIVSVWGVLTPLAIDTANVDVLSLESNHPFCRVYRDDFTIEGRLQTFGGGAPDRRGYFAGLLLNDLRLNEPTLVTSYQQPRSGMPFAGVIGIGLLNRYKCCLSWSRQQLELREEFS